ncbi:MAG: hypothetical protein IT322_10155 [Anaerolineae bacterium]|nr:hypothetical protein [Anaerolineae bacterium]
MHRLFIILLIVISAAALVTHPAKAQESGKAEITNPSSGTTLIGVITIQGTATSPDFQRYKLEFALQEEGDEIWFPLAEITQQVTAGTLAQWNTLNVQDGVYQIRLRVILRDGTVLQTSVQNLTVNNRSQTPLPTPLQPATAIPPTLIPTEGPTPTSLIQQPPTTAPRPTIQPVQPLATLPVNANNDNPFVDAFNAIRNAFCTGIVIALIGALLATVYRIGHRYIRPRWREWLAALRGEQ